MRTSEDDLVCDFAEFYHIYDWHGIPVRLAATLAAGLTEDARVVKKIAGIRHGIDRLMLVGIFDAVKLLVWLNSKDGEKGINRPKQISKVIFGEKKEEEALEVYEDATAFKKAREAILNGHRAR